MLRWCARLLHVVLNAVLPVTVGNFGDLFSYNPAAATWAVLSPQGSIPAARCCGFGFAATPDRKIYVFGGDGTSGMTMVWEGGSRRVFAGYP